MQRSSSSLAPLLYAWAAAIILTAGTIFTGDLLNGNISALGGYRLAALVVITALKAFLILHYYLNFRLAPKGWQKTSYGLVFLLLLCIALFFVRI